MRRLFAAGAVVLAMLTLAGCAVKTAGDGDVAGDWAVLPKATIPVPKAGVCRTATPEYVDWAMDQFDAAQVACTAKHSTETYYVGNITDAKTVALSEPPGAGEPAFKAIYQTCMKRAATLLGGDYHQARAAIVPVLPTDTEWRAEARFYRCEIMEITADHKVVQRSSSAKDGLKGKKPLAIGCATESVSSSGDITKFTWVSCSKGHHVEFTGLYTPPDGKRPSDKTLQEKASAGCLSVSLRYTGHTKSQMQYSGGFTWVYSGLEDPQTMWAVGDRTHRCYLGPYPHRKVTGSLKGKLPSQW